jgi:hypothetical protein
MLKLLEYCYFDHRRRLVSTSIKDVGGFGGRVSEALTILPRQKASICELRPETAIGGAG